MEERGSDHDNVEDDVLRQKEFRRGGGIDLGQFMIRDDEVQPENDVSAPAPEQDQAIGEIASIFQGEDEQPDEPGAIKRDGTVAEASVLGPLWSGRMANISASSLAIIKHPSCRPQAPCVSHPVWKFETLNSCQHKPLPGLSSTKVHSFDCEIHSTKCRKILLHGRSRSLQ